jgi:PKD repeat protein
LHLCVELKLKAMKKSVLMLASLVMMVFQLMAQSTPNDLHLTGYVTDANGAAVNGQYVCVSYFGENPNIPDSLCTVTNENGWYSIVVTNGSMTGPNQTFEVGTTDYCQNTVNYQSQQISNQQGTLDAATVSFTLNCDPNSGGGCNCAAQIVSTVAPNSSEYMFAVDIPCGTAPYQYQWWVNGEESSVATPAYDFTEDGVYGVCVTVADANGCSFTACDSLYIGASSCFAYWYYNSNPNGGIVAGTDNQFWFSGSTSSGSSAFLWSVSGGGLSLTSSQMNPSFNFPNAGNYEVCLTVIDSITMCMDEFCAPVSVVGGNTGSCDAYFAAVDSSGYNYFVNYSQGSGLSYAWDFGDGNTSTAMHPWHQYAQEGIYSVCLTVNGLNCQDSFCDTVVVGGLNTDSCSAFFYSSGPTPIGYSFSAMMQSDLYSYTWTVDNQWMPNNGMELYVPGFIEGAHTVCLTVSSNSCTDTYCETIVIGPDSICEGMISGQVFAGTLNQAIDQAIVYLIAYDDQTQQLAAMQATLADSMGYYYFSSIPCGEYLIKAAATQNSAFYSNHLPTYYGNSLFWQYAQTVGVSLAMPTVQYDIVLIAGNNPGGPGFIGGNVLQGANKVEADGEPLEGINVMLFDLSGNAIAYTMTDAEGSYAFDGVAYGSYQVYAELLNYTTIPAVVSLTAEEPSVEELTIFVGETFISTGIVEADMESMVGEVYPNPAVEMASISLELESDRSVSISIIDLTGRVLTTNGVNLMPGLNTHSFAVDGLTNGYYLLTVRDAQGAFSITRRFVVNR